MTSKPAGYNPAKFQQGTAVRIAGRDALEDFLRNWRYHHKLQPEQLAYGGRVAKVESFGMYHGGEVIYKLEDIPGVWHEQCLSAVGDL